MGYKTNSIPAKGLQKPSESATWQDAEGQEILQQIQNNLTVQQAASLLKYKELFPNGQFGFEWVIKKADSSVKKHW